MPALHAFFVAQAADVATLLDGSAGRHREARLLGASPDWSRLHNEAWYDLLTPFFKKVALVHVIKNRFGHATLVAAADAGSAEARALLLPTPAGAPLAPPPRAPARPPRAKGLANFLAAGLGPWLARPCGASLLVRSWRGRPALVLRVPPGSGGPLRPPSPWLRRGGRPPPLGLVGGGPQRGSSRQLAYPGGPPWPRWPSHVQRPHFDLLAGRGGAWRLFPRLLE